MQESKFFTYTGKDDQSLLVHISAIEHYSVYQRRGNPGVPVVKLNIIGKKRGYDHPLETLGADLQEARRKLTEAFKPPQFVIHDNGEKAPKQVQPATHDYAYYVYKGEEKTIEAALSAGANIMTGLEFEPVSFEASQDTTQLDKRLASLINGNNGALKHLSQETPELGKGAAVRQ